jgi:hypothetical protein
MEAILAAAARAVITADEAYKLGQMVDVFVRAIETSDFERRLKLLEDTDPMGRAPPRTYPETF